jgi:hypothetical protein
VDRPSVSDESRAEYDRIAERLALEAGAKAGKMMGMPTLFNDGKAFAGLFGDAMVFKLDGHAHARALDLPGATLFDPSGMGRPMKAWVQVPLPVASEWPSLAGVALEAMRTGAARS